MNDRELQRLLGRALDPPPLGDDAAIEAMLADAQDKAGADDAYGQGMLARAQTSTPAPTVKPPNKYLAIAALLFLAAIPIAIIAIANLPSGGGDGGSVAGGGGTSTNSGDGLVKISPEFPEPTFYGTPREIDLPNLEPGTSPRIDFTAPAGVHLVSSGAAVTSSTETPLLGSLAMVTDGQKHGDDTHFVELPPGHQWVQIDLGAEKKVFAITLWHYHKVMRAYRDIVVQLGNDPGFSSGVTIVFNSDHDNSLGFGAGKDMAYIETHLGRIIDVDGIPARYVRLHSNGNTTDDLNHYTEVEVYGL